MGASRRFAQVVRDYSAGLSDAEVLELTGLSFATYRRMLQGIVPSDAKIVQYAAGLGAKPDTLLMAAQDTRPKSDPIELMSHAIQQTGLSTGARLKLLNLLRELLEAEGTHIQSASA